MATATLSVRDIALKIKLPTEDLTAAINRARNWTREGLLPTVGEKHPGIGRERRYPERAMLDAMLLQVLTSAIGTPAVIATGAVKELKAKLGNTVDDLKELLAKHPKEDTVVVVSRSITDREWSAGVFWRSRLDKWIATRRNMVHVVVDAQMLHDLVEGGINVDHS